MDNRSRGAAIAAYITWIGFFVALIIRDRNDPFTAHHLNQALILNIASVIAGALEIIPIIGHIAGGILSLAVLAGWILGIYRAATWSTEPLPFIGDIHLMG